MKRWLSVLFVLAMACSFAACGESPCDKLKDICKKCEGADKTACDLSYETTQLPLVGPGDDGCQEILDAGTFDSCG